jgi:hypothetical protein
MNPRVECGECGIAMEEGFLADRGDHSRVEPSHWTEGSPEKSFLGGTKTRGKVQHRVVVHRCPRCGILKFYAPSGD